MIQVDNYTVRFAVLRKNLFLRGREENTHDVEFISIILCKQILGLVGRASRIWGLWILAQLRAKGVTRGGDRVDGRGVLQSCGVVE